DRVGTVEVGLQRIRGDVGQLPAHLRHLQLRAATGEADDLLDPLLAAERFEHAGADVAARPGDDHSHALQLPPAGRPNRGPQARARTTIASSATIAAIPASRSSWSRRRRIA